MDRRQRKSREAIFQAFSELLSQKSFYQITVSQIIEKADVGRATFYAHFETKDFLLKALCEELLCHIFDADSGHPHVHRHIFECDTPEPVFLHLFRHFGRNDHHILDLISGQNNGLFLQYFKSGLTGLIAKQLDAVSSALPLDYLINHIAATFVETVRWWAANGMRETPEQITQYFMLAVQEHLTPKAKNPLG
jgi:AcrR family transcriptional regulator